MKAFCEVQVVACEQTVRADGRICLNITIAALPSHFDPGATILFWDGSRPVPKCRTATVAAPSLQSTTLVALFYEQDTLPVAGEAMTIWSCLDEVVKVTAQSLIVTTRAFLYRIQPYAALGAEIVLDEGDEALWDTLRARFDGQRAWSSCFLALSPARLRGCKQAFPQAEPNAFVNLAMSCGIGACRSCHANLLDNKQGEPTCLTGPWFPLRRLDLEKLEASSQPFD